MFKAPRKTSINTKEYTPSKNAIGFAPELIRFILENQKLTTYRFGKKYDHFMPGDIVVLEDSSSGKPAGTVRITNKYETSFASLPLDNPAHEAYKNKEDQRKVLSGYYAYLGREIADNDLFLVFDFKLVSKA